MTTPAEQIRKTIQILESQDLDEISKIGTAIAGILAMAGAFAAPQWQRPCLLQRIYV